MLDDGLHQPRLSHPRSPHPLQLSEQRSGHAGHLTLPVAEDAPDRFQQLSLRRGASGPGRGETPDNQGGRGLLHAVRPREEHARLKGE